MNSPTTTTRHTARNPGSARPTTGWILAFVVGSLLAAPTLGSPPLAADEPGSTADALAWIDAELDSNGGFLPAPGSDQPDWGLTADVALAHISTGDGTSERTKAIAATLVGALGSYSTWDDIGPEYPGVRLAGPLAKVLLVAESAGLETTDVDGVDLPAELAGLRQSSGPQAGRYSDRNPYGPDVSNGFGQAYAMLAASLLGGVDPLSVQFLLAQQCPSGGFRLVYGDDPGCTSDDESDPDATALAVQVLLVLERTDAVGSALARATGQLLSIQGGDGSFAGAPPADVANANTTGLAAQALRAAGQVAAADTAAAWVAGRLQLGASASGTPAAADVGAIAYAPAKRSEALSVGIGASRDQWRRATPQGLLAFDAGLIAAEVDGPPVEPVVPSTTPPPTSSSTPPATPDAGSAQPPTDPTAADNRPAAPGATVAGAQSGGAGSTGAELAATGPRGGSLTATGVALLAIGMSCIWLGVRTRPRREAWRWQP